MIGHRRRWALNRLGVVADSTGDGQGSWPPVAAREEESRSRTLCQVHLRLRTARESDVTLLYAAPKELNNPIAWKSPNRETANRISMRKALADALFGFGR